jgi:hypothetical protein
LEEKVTNFEAQYSKFRLDDKLTKDFSNFETEWSLKQKTQKSYSIITIMNNDAMNNEKIVGHENNA